MSEKRVSLCRELSFKPDRSDVQRVVESVFLGLFNYALTAQYRIVGGDYLNRNTIGECDVLKLLGGNNLHHGDILLGRIAVIENIAGAHQRFSLIGGKLLLFGCCQTNEPLSIKNLPVL